MTKVEFLKELELGLAVATADERVAALQYYTEYLDEAGPENEAAAIEELGSPQKIIADILGSSYNGATSGAWMPPPPSAPEPDPAAYAAAAATYPPIYAPGYEQPQQTASYNPDNSRIAKIILIILVCIFAMPLLGSVGGVLIGVAVALFSIFFIPIMLGLALLGGGVAMIISGAMISVVSIGNGLVFIGLGVFFAALGLLCCYGGIRLLGRTMPRIFRSLFSGFSALFRKLTGVFHR